MLDFLGRGQTFYGVLSTIIVLCIFRNSDGNFISKILEQIKKRLQVKVSELKVHIDDKNLTNKLGEKLATETDEGKLARYGELMTKVSMVHSDLSIYKMMSFFSHYKDKYERIMQSDEIVRAPLYTFIFSIMVFLFDEYFRGSFFPFKEMVFTTLSFLTLFSVIYWSVIWINFIYRAIGDKRKENEEISSEKRNLALVVIALLYIMCVPSFMILELYLLGEQYTNAAKVLFWLSAVVPGVGAGKYFLSKHPKSNNGFYQSLLFHIMGILFLAVYVSLCLHLAINYVNSSFGKILLSDDGNELLKMAVFCFTLGNGLFMPFFCPLGCSYWIYRLQAKAKIFHGQKVANRKFDQYDVEFEKILKS